MTITAADAQNISQQHHLKLILLHGSVLSGQTHAQSDIDLAVLPEKNQDLNILDLFNSLAKLGYSNTDIVNLDTANPLLLKTITDRAQILAGKKEDLDKLQLKALHLYNDYLPYLKLEKQYVTN